LGRAFDPSALVAHLLDQTKPTPAEMDAIRQTVEQYHEKQRKP
jgi:hypothetical protein